MLSTPARLRLANTHSGGEEGAACDKEVSVSHLCCSLFPLLLLPGGPWPWFFSSPCPGLLVVPFHQQLALPTILGTRGTASCSPLSLVTPVSLSLPERITDPGGTTAPRACLANSSKLRHLPRGLWRAKFILFGEQGLGFGREGSSLAGVCLQCDRECGNWQGSVGSYLIFSPVINSESSLKKSSGVFVGQDVPRISSL